MAQKRKRAPGEAPITVLFVDEEELNDGSGGHKYIAVPFVARRDAPHANKFLFWPAPALSDGRAIIAIGSSKESLVNHPHLLTKLIHLGIVNPLQIPTGAGEFRDGKVVSWENTVFGITTPSGLIPMILNALGLD